MQSLYRFFGYLLLFFTFIRIRIYFKWNPDHKCRPYAFFTFKSNGSTHFLDQLPCNGHSQSGSDKLCAASCMFLCKWFKNMFLELLSHSDSCIPADKFHCRHSWLFGWDFHAAKINMSIFSVIFHCIGQDIHHHTFYIPRASNKITVYDFFFLPYNPDILFCSNLFNYNKHFLRDFAQIKWTLFQNNFTRLQLTHVQNIIYQFQQQIGCRFNLCSVFLLLLHIICIMVCHIDQTVDSINRSPDIVAHTMKELCFCLIGGFCLFRCCQKFCFIFFIFFKFLFPVRQIGSVCPEPEYAEHQKIKKNNTYNT